MFRSFFVIAIRHLVRHRLFTLINITCLAAGITFAMIIGVYVVNQEKVNTQLNHISGQYLIKSKWKVKEMGMDITTIAPLAKTMKETYPGLVRNYYRYNPVTTVLSAGDNHFMTDIAIGDTTLVSMYGFPLLYGDPNQAFYNNNSAVITESKAIQLFGTKNVIGRRVSMQTTVNNQSQDYTISAVLKDIPYNSVTHLIGNKGYDLFVPTEGNQFYQGGDPSLSWNAVYEVGFLELQPGIMPGQLKGPFSEVVRRHAPTNISSNLQVELASVKDYYIRSNEGSMQKMIDALALIAAFILFMAVVNFINISIGTSSYRLKEIGLRKVLGGLRRQLIMQFMTEACLLTVIAALLSLGLYEALRPSFDRILNTSLNPVWHLGPVHWLLLAGLVALVGLASGIYPAFVLSSISSVTSVKGKTDTARGSLMLRRGLLVVQFTLAIIVFICSLVISRQVSYVFNKDLGYSKDQVLILNAFPKQWDSVGVRRIEAVRKGLQQSPVVRSASLTFEVPDRRPPGSIPLLPVGKKSGGQPLVVSSFQADEHYAEAFSLQMEEGSFFRQGGAHIPGQIVLNESAARAIGLEPGSAVGARIRIAGTSNDLTVAGVVKDYNYSSLQQRIDPMAFLHVMDAPGYRYIALKLNAGSVATAIEEVRSRWKVLSPTAPFEFTFMDERFGNLYRSELQLKEAAGVATALNLLIVLLGIFGVIAFTLARRTREIAVRKVLGARVAQLASLFMKDYAWLLLIANVIGWPLAYILSNNWLSNYAYRIHQDLIPYLIVGVFIFLAAFVLISAQCIRAARANPINSLRAE